MSQVISTPSPPPGPTTAVGRPPVEHGVIVRTAISAGGTNLQHAEGVVVTSAISAGGVQAQHAEGIVESTTWRKFQRLSL